MRLVLPRWAALLVVWVMGFFDPGKWGVWDYAATIVNDGVNSGSQVYEFTPGAGNVCILIIGSLLNGDTGSRNGQALVRNGDDTAVRRVFANTTMAGGVRRQFPTSELSSDDNHASDGTPVIVSGVEDLEIALASVAVSENSAVEVQMLVSGGPPTVVLTSPTGATETETENRIV